MLEKICLKMTLQKKLLSDAIISKFLQRLLLEQKQFGKTLELEKKIQA